MPTTATNRRGREALVKCALALLAALLLLAGPGAARAQDSKVPPAVPPPAPFVFPTAAERVLDNGLTVLVLERRALPQVTLRLVVKAGAESDPAGGEGTAQLVTALLNQGTRDRSALQIAEAIDEAGGSIDTGADWDSSYASLSMLSDHTRQAFELLADMVLHPAFRPAEVARKRQHVLSALQVAHDDPGYVADTLIQDLVLAGTPYGHPQDGTPDSVRRLTAGDLRTFHARYYRPGNAYLAVTGDIATEEAFRLAREYFGKWKGSGEAVLPGAPSATRAKEKDHGRRLLVIDKPDAVQTEIRIGLPGIRRTSGLYDALSIANQVLGGPATNRLFNSLRTRQGLTYGASSKLVCFRSAGMWEISTFTRTTETAKALGAALEVMKDLRDHSIRNSELSMAQGYLQGHLALRFETPEAVARAELKLLVDGLPVSYWNQFSQRIQSLDVREVRNATRHYLYPDHSVIVLVGNAQEFLHDLKSFGKVRVIPLTQLDFGSPTLEARPAPKAQGPHASRGSQEQGSARTLASR